MSDFFLDLTPDQILNAGEQLGIRSTGRCFALNSLENRVNEIEMQDSAPIVGKFYRPGRWSREQILEEHQFLNDLALAEIPVVEPLKLKNGLTLGTLPDGIMFALFPKVRGRAPEELTDDQVIQLGRLVARMHNVGASRKAEHRMQINVQTYGYKPLEFLIKNQWLPMDLQADYQRVVEGILKAIEPLFEGVATHRIHGDCHLGNLLYNSQGPFFLDFDDMLIGPAVQDLWLIMPGRDEEAKRQRDIFLTGYTEMREFDRTTLELVEPLRALRIIHYSAWVAKRWQDASFPKAFPEFNTHRYWQLEILDLQKQLYEITSGQQAMAAPTVSVVKAPSGSDDDDDNRFNS